MSEFMQQNAPLWLKRFFLAAGIYNVLAALFLLFFPLSLFRLAGLPVPLYPIIIQFLALLMGLFGIGYIIASANPYRHWPIVLLGLLAKLLSSSVYLWDRLHGYIPREIGLFIIADDLLWCLPFVITLYEVYRLASRPMSWHIEWDGQALENMICSSGRSVLEISSEKTVMLVFLRHFGCTFCKEMLRKLQAERSSIEKQNTEIILVSMGNPERASEVYSHYGLDDLEAVSDEDRIWYHIFGLGKASFRQLLGLRTWWRGFYAGIIKRNGISWIEGDGFQMPGVFLLRQGQIIRSFTPDYIGGQIELSEFLQTA